MTLSRLTALTCLTLLATSLSESAFAGTTLGTTGDILAVAMPLAAAGLAYHKQDDEGLKQWAESTATTMVLTETLKQAFAKTDWGTRPNGDSKSFPSGHTAAACSAAGFLSERYGWESGAPAYGLAAVVAYTRVHEHKHYVRDVIAGCALATGSAMYWVSPRQNVQVTPVVEAGHWGVSVIASF